MALARKPFQGVGNILRFNWPFYALAGGVLIVLFVGSYWLPVGLQIWAWGGIVLAVLGIVLSTFASWWIYDNSDLYLLRWLPATDKPLRILNIAAGFDEISPLLKERFPNAAITIADFYDAKKHTEPSIQRARKAYPPARETVTVTTRKLPFENHYFDIIVGMLAVHEIRDAAERSAFMQELNRVLKPEGSVYITEHLRDIANFGVYNIGAFHFHSRHSWLRNFEESGFKIARQWKTTPFVTTFMLAKNGNPT